MTFLDLQTEIKPNPSRPDQTSPIVITTWANKSPGFSILRSPIRAVFFQFLSLPLINPKPLQTTWKKKTFCTHLNQRPSKNIIFLCFYNCPFVYFSFCLSTFDQFRNFVVVPICCSLVLTLNLILLLCVEAQQLLKIGLLIIFVLKKRFLLYEFCSFLVHFSL